MQVSNFVGISVTVIAFAVVIMVITEYYPRRGKISPEGIDFISRGLLQPPVKSVKNQNPERVPLLKSALKSQPLWGWVCCGALPPGSALAELGLNPGLSKSIPFGENCTNKISFIAERLSRTSEKNGLKTC